MGEGFKQLEVLLNLHRAPRGRREVLKVYAKADAVSHFYFRFLLEAISCQSRIGALLFVLYCLFCFFKTSLLIFPSLVFIFLDSGNRSVWEQTHIFFSGSSVNENNI